MRKENSFAEYHTRERDEIIIPKKKFASAKKAFEKFTANAARTAQIVESAIKDSGERTEFATGAVRDMHTGKGDMASVPWEAILRLSVHYENGAKKYDRWNFRKGIPVSSFIDSACRHLAKYQCGMDDEDHLAAAAFNVLGAMLMENTMPEMNDLPLRAGKNTFSYFKDTERNENTCVHCGASIPEGNLSCKNCEGNNDTEL